MVKRRRSHFNLSRNSKLTMKAGSLIPIYCEKVLPNDVIGAKVDMLIRVAPQIAPLLDSMKVKTYFFYCPTRLLDPRGEENYTKWFTGQGCKTYSCLEPIEGSGRISFNSNHFVKDGTTINYQDNGSVALPGLEEVDYLSSYDLMSNSLASGAGYAREGQVKTLGSVDNPVARSAATILGMEENGYQTGRSGYDTFKVPIKYPHFDVTLPKIWFDALRKLPPEQAKKQWLGNVPYRGMLAPFFTEVGSLADYFGVCVGEGKWGDNYNIFPFLMYRMCFNEFFVDPLKRDPLPDKLFTYKECFGNLFLPENILKGKDFDVASESNILAYGSSLPLMDDSFVEQLDSSGALTIPAGADTLKGLTFVGHDSIAPAGRFMGVYGLEGYTASNQEREYEFTSFGYKHNSSWDLIARHEMENCYPLIDPYTLGSNFGQSMSFGLSSSGSNTSYSFTGTSHVVGNPMGATGGETRSVKIVDPYLPIKYFDSDNRVWSDSGVLFNLNLLVSNAEQSGIVEGVVNDEFIDPSGNYLPCLKYKSDLKDSWLGTTGQALAQNYSIFNDLLYKPAKRNLWNTCICDPTFMGEKFVVPVDNTGSTFDFTEGGTSMVRHVGLDIRELKIYSRIGLFFNYLAYTGDKYEDQLRLIYGTRPADLRIKKPKFIGSGTSNLVFSEVINTAGAQKTEGNQLQQGTSTGYGFGLSKRHGFKYHAKEEGYILGVMVVEPRGRDYAARPTALNVPKSYYDIPNPFFDGIGNVELKVSDFMPHKFMGLRRMDFSNYNGLSKTPIEKAFPDLISGYAEDYYKRLFSDNIKAVDDGYEYNTGGHRVATGLMVNQGHEGTMPNLAGFSADSSTITYSSSYYASALYVKDAAEDKTFGYQKQFFDYRHAVPEVHGEYLLSKRASHLTRFFNEMLPDYDKTNIYLNDNLHFGGDKYIGIGSFATDMLALDTYRYNAVDRIFELASYEHPFWVDLNIKSGVSRILSKKGGISLQ